MRKLIIRLLSVHGIMSREKLLTQIGKHYLITDRELRKFICKLIDNGDPIASTLKGYSIVKSWKDWEVTDKFLQSYIKNLQRRRTRLKKNVKQYLINPKLIQ